MDTQEKLITGYIYDLKKEKKFGFISVDGETENYFFTSHDLENCNILSLQGGETVEFIPYETYKGKCASCVRVKYQIDQKQSIPSLGINSHVDLNRTPMNEDEKQITYNLSSVFYVTSGGGEIKLNDAKYRYCLIKPTEFFVNNFQMFRELVVVFSDYVHFEPRSLDVATEVYKLITTPLRLDKGCHLLICHDDQVEEKMARCLKDSNVNQIVIPFTYSELLQNKTPEYLIQERFRKYLFNSDLFSTLSPITDQNFFFGRRDLVHDIVSKCKNKGHCGIFGLRRSGKTSVLYAITSLLKNDDYHTVFIPCEGELRTLDWRMALHLVVKNVYKALHFSENDINEKVKESNYNSLNTTMYFEDDMNRVLQNLNKPVIIMFDEIEAITFNVSRGNEADNVWLDGKSFLNFWNTIKGYYSKHPGKISIVVAGTNPMINEEPVIGKNKEPNPMFSQLSSPNQGEYLQAFTIEDTANMVNTLGSYMGLNFDQYSIDKLTYDCGGHPYLMRMLCSHINKYIKNHNIDKPYTVTKAVYDKASAEFEKSSDAESFFEMILNILMISYHKEYETLKILATQGDDIVARIQDKKALHHLFGYSVSS